MNNCTLRDATNPEYIASDLGFQNVLWGDYIYVNTSKNFADGGALVHIEASTTDPATTTPGRYTFSGRSDGWNASNHRYADGGSFTGGTSFVVWRDSKTSQSAFTCPVASGHPTWYPLGAEGIQGFDEQEQVLVPPTYPSSPLGIIPFPAATQRTKINSVAFAVPFNFGWIFLDLNHTVTGNANPSSDPAAAQGWVIYDMDSNGHFSVGFEGLRLDSACAPNHTMP